MSNGNIYAFSDEPRGRLPDTSAEVTWKKTANFGPSTIIIDNGSYECRAGYAAQQEPCLTFKNLVYRQKGRNSDPDMILVGMDLENLETLRSQLKSPFDKNVVTQFDAQEMVCDYIFSKLGVTSEEQVDHPVFMSEPIVNPNHCRKYMSELLFECYSTPCIGYYTDALGAWYHSQGKATPNQNALIVSIGYQTTHVIPVVDGAIDQPNVRRISIGGYHLDFFMQRLLQLKYPIHSPVISLSRSEEIVQKHAWIAEHYQDTCTSWLDESFYDKKAKKMQLPYGNVPANFAAVALQGERQVERARLTKEKQALEKLEDKIHIYDQLCEIRDLTGTKLYRRLAELGVDSLGELQCHIKAVQSTVDDLKRKLVFKEEYNKGTLTKEWLQQKIDNLDNMDSSANPPTFDIAEYYQLHVGIEQTRVPELLFQPSMIGIDHGGVTETVSYVLTKYPKDTQDSLSRNIILTGGSACIPGLRDRVEAETRAVRPFKSEIGVTLAEDPVYGSWKGACDWLKTDNCRKTAITKSMYDELGGEYLLEHPISNKFYATPSAAN